MTDQLTGWLQVVLGFVSLLLTLIHVKSTVRRRRRWICYSRWKVWGLERQSFEMTDDSQS